LTTCCPDSGRISGNIRQPHRYHRRLLRVLYLSAQVAARCCPTSRTFYGRKRGEGKLHRQAVLVETAVEDGDVEAE
jgi:hypothetical protein